MTFVITQTCVDEMDQSCVDVCPVDCIHFDEGTDRMLYIDPVECIDCGACQPACPVTAIFPEGDVPADQQHFTEINALWYQDPAAARAKLGGVPAPAAGSAPAPAAEAAPAQDAAASAETAAEDEDEVATAAVSVQVEAAEEAPAEGVVVPSYSQPSPLGLVAVVGFAASFFVMWVFPGPRWLEIGGVGLHVGVLLSAPPALVFLFLFLRSQGLALSTFAARQERRADHWRSATVDWRRAEDSRAYDLVTAVREIADERFRFPNDEFPAYRTHVNLPEPAMAIEFGGGGGEKVYPDILVVEYPGNYPVMVAQVETRDTLTREQASRVWARLENAQAPLDVYVPAGLAAHARDYARAAGIKHIRFRTWRRQPEGVTVREV